MSGVDYDQVLGDIGELGPWQKKLFALLWIPSATSAMAVFMYDFTAYVPPHRCFVPDCDNLTVIDNGNIYPEWVNWTIPWDQKLDQFSQCETFKDLRNSSSSSCQRDDFNTETASCSSWIFDHDLIHSSAVEDYGMVCQDSPKKGLTQTIYMLGMLIGSFLFGWAGDFMGRKVTLMVALVTLTVGGSFPFLITPHPANYYALVISRFISGLGHVGTFMITFNLALEYVGPKWRTTCGILIETPFACGGLVVGLVSWAGVRDWQTLSLVLSLPNILLLSYWWLLPESPRWLIAKNKEKQLVKVLENAAKSNKRTLPDLNKMSSSGSSNLSGKASVLDLFRPFPILIRSLTMFFNWLVTTMCYYGLTSAAATLTSDLYLNFTLAIAVEIPAHFACLLVLDRWGRKPVLGFSQLLAGLTCVAAGFITTPSLQWLQICLALIGKFGATMSFAVVFVYTAEMFPTEIRSTAVGTSSLCGRIGGLIAPQVASLGSLWIPLPLLIMGSGALVGGILVFLSLPETLGEKLPDTMEEALMMGKNKSPEKS